MPSPSLRILCVEDDADICELLTTTLAFSSFEAVCVSEVGAAHALMEKEKFCLYILDGQLPGASGLTLCQEIRAADKVTPIVIFSGHGKTSDRAAGLRAGADVYILKPDMNEIVPTVKRLLKQEQVPAF
ncbi:MAG TPA: response regulator [Pyrinomonadaceae bacterium]|nr:response regulator [Pyrinomonadaceae bacterium]